MCERMKSGRKWRKEHMLQTEWSGRPFWGGGILGGNEGCKGARHGKEKGKAFQAEETACVKAWRQERAGDTEVAKREARVWCAFSRKPPTESMLTVPSGLCQRWGWQRIEASHRALTGLIRSLWCGNWHFYKTPESGALGWNVITYE